MDLLVLLMIGRESIVKLPIFQLEEECVWAQNSLLWSKKGVSRWEVRVVGQGPVIP